MGEGQRVKNRYAKIFSAIEAQLKKEEAANPALKDKKFRREVANDRAHFVALAEYNKKSLKDLNDEQILHVARACGFKTRNPKPVTRKLKYSDMDGRPGWASGAQLRLIEALWKTGKGIKDRSDTALSHFLHNRFGISFLSMLPATTAGKAIEALKDMTRRVGREDATNTSL